MKSSNRTVDRLHDFCTILCLTMTERQCKPLSCFAKRGSRFFYYWKIPSVTVRERRNAKQTLKGVVGGLVLVDEFHSITIEIKL